MILRELGQTLRALRRKPWYALTVIGVIALGMMLSTTVFAIVDGVVFKPLPYPDAGRLFTVQAGFKGIDKRHSSVSAADLAAWSASAPDVAFAGFSAARWSGFGEGVNDDVAGLARVQANVFDVLGVRPFVGGFTADDFEHTALIWPVVITYELWQGRFRGDPAIVGRTVELEPVQHGGYRIVGVMPRGFLFPTEGAEVQFITPYVLQGELKTDPQRRVLFEVIARVPRSVSALALRARVEAGMAMTAAAFPSLGPKPPAWSDRNWRQQGPFDDVRIEPLSVSLGSQSRPLFGAILLAVSILVSLGAINASGLIAARTLDRGREVGVRRALGASRTAIARMVFLEVATLVGAGSLLGLLGVAPLLHLAVSLLPEEIVLLKPAQVDWRVTAFAVLGALVLAVPAAVWPIRRALGAGWTGIADGGRTAPRSRSAGQFVLVAAQVAGAFVLTVGGALLVGSLLTVYSHARPIRTDGVVAIETMLQGLGPDALMGRKSPARAARVDAILDRLRRVPGVEAAAVTGAQVLRGGSWPSWFTPPPGAANRKLTVDVQTVAGDYYRVVQPQLVSGRLPTDAELAGKARVIVVSESVARAYWPVGSPIGQLLAEEGDTDPYTVIGVVRDVRWFSWDTTAASIYGPFASLSRWPIVTFMIRTGGDTARVTASALGALADTDPLMKPMRAATLDDLFIDSVRSRRFRSWLFGVFAVAGLTVVGVGILGLLAMSTARRTREMGIRSALGATRGGITKLLLREQLSPVLTGLVAGGCLAVWTATLVKSYLYEVTIADSRVWTMAVALLILTALLGALLPAIQAGRTDPSNALRAE